MKQEYLVKSIEDKDEIDSYFVENVSTKTESIDEAGIWIISYETKGDDESAAKILSDVHEKITQNESITTLLNESSAYYNRRLFPLVNEFEWKLRKLLYLSISVNRGEYDASNISNLEAMDLGKIFELIFLDAEYYKTLKTKIVNPPYGLNKKKTFELIEEIDETSLWDLMLGSDSVSSLKDNFHLVKEYRNDVMHAHSMSHAKYNKVKRLYKKINKQLDLKISELQYGIDRFDNESFNEDLNKAIYKFTVDDTYLNELFKKISYEIVNRNLAKEYETLFNKVAEEVRNNAKG